jgi:hypothetical protein
VDDGTERRLPTSNPDLPYDLKVEVEDGLLRAYRDGFEAALIAVNNTALVEFGGRSEYAAVLRAIDAAEVRLREHLDSFLDGRTLSR